MKTIAIDFDGVIHKYSKGWLDGSIYDEPFEGVFETIMQLMREHTVFVFTARSPRQIKKWLKEHCYYEHDMPCDPYIYGFSVKIIPFWKKFWNKPNCLGITRKKLPAMIYIDDRALKFESWEQIKKELLTPITSKYKKI